MKLDVPNLFTDSQSGTSGPGENFKELLHFYIASNGLQRELLKNVDVIMVSFIWCYYNAKILHVCTRFFEASVSDSHTCGENGKFSIIVIYIVYTYMLLDLHFLYLIYVQLKFNIELEWAYICLEQSFSLLY